jgi:hypothetical protein
MRVLRDYRVIVCEDCIEQVELKINVVLEMSTGDRKWISGKSEG